MNFLASWQQDRHERRYFDSAMIGDSRVILRSRFQPFLTVHEDAIRYFFNGPFREIHNQTGSAPLLILGVVADILRGTRTAEHLHEDPEYRDSYGQRLKPEFNPLTPCEILEDIFIVIHKLPEYWRRFISVTIMPEFVATLRAIHQDGNDEDRQFIELLLPSAAYLRWLIPKIDEDDLFDIELAGKYFDNSYMFELDAKSPYRVFRVEAEGTPTESMGNGYNGLGLYAYATYLLWTSQEEMFLRLLPAGVASRWRGQNVFGKARERCRQKIEHGSDMTAALAAMHRTKNLWSAYPTVDVADLSSPGYRHRPRSNYDWYNRLLEGQ